MSTPRVIAAYCRSKSKWEIFRLDGISLNLYGGQRMVTLAQDTVMIVQENSHYMLWVLPPAGSHKQLEELFGINAFKHLDALARLNQPTSSLDELEARLQHALDAAEATKWRRPELLAV